MIASFTHNFIFIRTRKTAGTSAEIVLSAWCSDPDIITPLLPTEDEMLRVDYGGLPRNFGGPPDLQEAYIQAVARRDQGEVDRLHIAIRRSPRHDRFYGHMPARLVRDKLPHLWEPAATFTVERHPYEKVISWAYWRMHARVDQRPIDEIIEDVISDRKLSDKYIYAEGDQLLVDKVIPYNKIWEGIGELAASLGRSLPDPLPRSKSNARTDRRPPRDLLSADQRRRIAEQCAFEFELMAFER